MYNAKPHVGDKYAADTWIKIVVQQAWHKPKYPGMGEAIYRAKLYRLAVDMESSCYYVDFPFSHRTKLCVVPRGDSVAFPVDYERSEGDTSEIQAIAAIQFNYSGETTEGSYNISRRPPYEYEHSVISTFKKTLLPKLGESIGRQWWQMDRMVSVNKPEKNMCEVVLV